MIDQIWPRGILSIGKADEHIRRVKGMYIARLGSIKPFIKCELNAVELWTTHSHIYIHYIIPELCFVPYHFRSGKGARPL